MAILLVKNRAPGSTVPPTSMSFAASNAASNVSSITAPADIAAGDLIVCYNWHRDAIGGVPATAVPSGFTEISNVNDAGDARVILSYKLATGAEGSSTLNGMSSATGDGAMIVTVFRGDNPAGVLTVRDPDGQITNLAPTDQTIAAASGAVPLVVLAGYASGNDIGTIGFTPAQDATLSATAGASLIRFRYKVYNSNPADTTVTKNDSGADNVLQSCYIEAA